MTRRASVFRTAIRHQIWTRGPHLLRKVQHSGKWRSDVFLVINTDTVVVSSKTFFIAHHNNYPNPDSTVHVLLCEGQSTGFLAISQFRPIAGCASTKPLFFEKPSNCKS